MRSCPNGALPRQQAMICPGSEAATPDQQLLQDLPDSLSRLSVNKCSAYDCSVPARGKAVVKTDIAIAIPPGTYARIAPRSGLAVKHFIDTGKQQPLVHAHAAGWPCSCACCRMAMVMPPAVAIQGNTQQQHEQLKPSLPFQQHI